MKACSTQSTRLFSLCQTIRWVLALQLGKVSAARQVTKSRKLCVQTARLRRQRSKRATKSLQRRTNWSNRLQEARQMMPLSACQASEDCKTFSFFQRETKSRLKTVKKISVSLAPTKSTRQNRWSSNRTSLRTINLGWINRGRRSQAWSLCPLLIARTKSIAPETFLNCILKKVPQMKFKIVLPNSRIISLTK